MRLKPSIGIFYLLLISCSLQGPDDEYTKQLLGQLKEIKSELQALKLETSQLRSAVTEIHRQTVTTPTANPIVPEVLVEEVEIGGETPIQGAPDAAIGIVEFSDYECPFCTRFYSQTLPELKKQFIEPGKARFAYRDYPLDFHQEAKRAAIVASCAGRQGQYWVMHDRLFEHQRELGDDLYKKLSLELKLDEKVFTDCLKSPEQVERVNQELAYAGKLGVSGTPTFFIGRIEGNKLVNPQRITGAQPFSVLSHTIEGIQKQ
ncbi:MAG: DsbA family protein [Methylococcales bacterium]